MNQKLTHYAFFLHTNFLDNVSVRPVLSQIMFKHYLCQTQIKIVAAQKCIAIGCNVLDFQNFGRVLPSGNFMQSYVESAAAEIENHNIFFLTQIQNLLGNFSVANLIYKIVNNCSRLGQ